MSATDEPPAAPPLDRAMLEALLASATLGHPLIYFPAIASTNSHALALARAGAAEGTLVTTDHQVAGRGRVGRVWRSLPGQGLALSLVLRPTFPPQLLVMAAALAVAEAIEASAGVAAAIKWPNDVLVGGRKVAGILIESGGTYAIVGIGVNVNGSLAADSELAPRATTLADVTGHPLTREPLAADMVRRLDAIYAQRRRGGAAARGALRASWRARLETLGQRVRVTQGDAALEGLAEDVDGDGALIVRLADGARRLVTWGDVAAIAADGGAAPA